MIRLIISRSHLTVCILLVLATIVTADLVNKSTSVKLSPAEIEEQLQKCDLPRRLAAQKQANAPSSASFTSKLFAILFPSSRPAVNALLATAYISGPPNFLLALCPPNIDPSSLSIMVAFAVGGLLGDTFFHLLPEIFLGEDEHDKVRFVMLEPNRNLLLGVGILVGVATFMGMDKALRIATGGQASHDHTHSHDHGASKKHDHQTSKKKLKKVETREEEQQRLKKNPYNEATTSGASTHEVVAELARTNTDLRKRAKGEAVEQPSSPSSSSSEDDEPTVNTSQPLAPVNPSVKLAGILNLIADFTHNITDGLAMSSSFYASPALGATTTMAVFFHEIPHEVGDFALLIQSGFSKRNAMAAQFVTAIGAFLGTLIGIMVQEYSGNSASAADSSVGIFGTSLQWGDMLLPFTAGTFLYVGTVGVIPELLETGPNKFEELKKTGMQFGAMALGALIMIAISWH